MPGEIAQAFVRVRANTAGFQKEVAAGIGPSLKRAALGFAGISAGIFGIEKGVEILRDGVTSAARVQKQVETISQIFGESGVAVEHWANNVAASLGVTDDAALETAARIGILAKNLGIAQPKAAEMTLGFEKLAASIAQIRGTDPAVTFAKLPQILAGNTRSLKEMGFAFSNAQIKAKAVELGIIGVKDAITPAAKAQAIYALITKDLAYYEDLAAKHSGDLLNRQRVLNAQWDQAKQRLGTALLPSLARLAGYLSTELPKAADRTATAFHDINIVVHPLLELIGGLGNAIKIFIGYKLAGVVGGWITKLVALGTTSQATATIIVEANATETTAINTTAAAQARLNGLIAGAAPAAAAGAAGVEAAAAAETAALGSVAGAAAGIGTAMAGLARIAPILLTVTVVMQIITKGPKKFGSELFKNLSGGGGNDDNILKTLFGTDLGASKLGDTLAAGMNSLLDKLGVPNHIKDKVERAQGAATVKLAKEWEDQFGLGAFLDKAAAATKAEATKNGRRVKGKIQVYQQLQLDLQAALRTPGKQDELRVANAILDIFNKRVANTKLTGNALFELKQQQQNALDTVAQITDSINQDAQAAAEAQAAKDQKARDKLAATRKRAQAKAAADFKRDYKQWHSEQIRLLKERFGSKVGSSAFNLNTTATEQAARPEDFYRAAVENFRAFGGGAGLLSAQDVRGNLAGRLLGIGGTGASLEPVGGKGTATRGAVNLVDPLVAAQNVHAEGQARRDAVALTESRRQTRYLRLIASRTGALGHAVRTANETATTVKGG